MSRPPCDGVVLAGGAARRLGGEDKAALRVGGVALLDRVLAATEDLATVVVVGPVRPVSRPVVWVQESPPGGGPVAGLAAGLSRVTALTVAVLAADLPFLTAAVLAALRTGLAASAGPGAPLDAMLLVDAGGQDQLLAGVWRTEAVRAALPARAAGSPFRTLVQGLRVGRLSTAEAAPPPWLDCDTPADLAAARRLAGGPVTGPAAGSVSGPARGSA